MFHRLFDIFLGTREICIAKTFTWYCWRTTQIQCSSQIKSKKLLEYCLPLLLNASFSLFLSSSPSPGRCPSGRVKSTLVPNAVLFVNQCKFSVPVGDPTRSFADTEFQWIRWYGIIRLVQCLLLFCISEPGEWENPSRSSFSSSASHR